MDSGDYYWGLYRDYYWDPFPRSLLSTRQKAMSEDLGFYKETFMSTNDWRSRQDSVSGRCLSNTKLLGRFTKYGFGV